MLFALLLLGLLPAALMFDRADAGDAADDDAPDGAGIGHETAGGGADFDDGAGGHPAEAGHDDAGEADDPDAVMLEVPAGSEAATVSAFRPGTDTLVVNLGSAGSGFHATEDDGSASLHIEGDDDCVVTFDGLDRVPVADIVIRVTDPLTGGITTFRLADLTGAGGLDDDDPAVDDGDTPVPGDGDPGIDPDADDGDVLDPGDGDPGIDPDADGGDSLDPGDGDPGIEPDVDDGDGPGGAMSAAAGFDPRADAPAGEDGDPGIEPDVDAGDTLGPGDGDPGIGPDADGGDSLDPGDGDPGIEPEPGDTVDVLGPVTAGRAGDAIPHSDGPAEIEDFEAGEDVMHIGLDPALHAMPPEVTVGRSADGADGEVRIGGELVAILRGVPGATLADVRVGFAP